MPQLRFHAFPVEKVKALSMPLSTELSTLTGVPREYFTLECLHSTFISEGQETPGDPFIEVYCFDRGAEMFDKMSEAITQHVHSVGISEVGVAFILLERRRYYENGQHLANLMRITNGRATLLD
ncbi:MAG: 23S rRNA pseudouridine synthase D [Bacillota bacterium]|nr:MAG: 23S rRNA pseudouridine synthase D [Bacillota bacterium]MBS3950038.1 DUF1904 family protein [Peptococcaceae bacterium]